MKPSCKPLKALLTTDTSIHKARVGKSYAHLLGNPRENGEQKEKSVRVCVDRRHRTAKILARVSNLTDSTVVPKRLLNIPTVRGHKTKTKHILEQGVERDHVNKGTNHVELRSVAVDHLNKIAS